MVSARSGYEKNIVAMLCSVSRPIFNSSPFAHNPLRSVEQPQHNQHNCIDKNSAGIALEGFPPSRQI